MNPNDILAGLNLFIAAAWFSWGGLFVWSYFRVRPPAKSGRWFLIGFALVALYAGVDMATTGVLRILDQVVFPEVPNYVLPDFSEFPLGIAVLIVVRIIEATLLWASLFVVTAQRAKEDREEEKRNG